MKNIRTYLLSILAAGFVLSLSCDEDEDLTAQQLADNPLPTAPAYNSGSLNVSKYVSIGNSLAAGFQDGALYNSAQETSFANLLAQQLMANGVGGGAFNQPDINSENGFSGMGPNGPQGRFELSLSQLAPVPTVGQVPGEYEGDRSALNNFAVPGMRLIDVNDPMLAANNPLYGRFASVPGTSTVLSDALAANPSFYTFWLGNNDILGYAASGGLDEAQISDALTFQNELTAALGALASSGAQGMVMNVPPIVVAPYFRAVPYNPIPLDEATATALNGAFEGYNQILNLLAVRTLITAEEAAARQVTFAAGPNNPLLIDDDALTDIGPLLDALLAGSFISEAQRAALEPYRIARQATPLDLPTLPAATEIRRDVLGNGQLLSGISYPLADNFVLSASEVQNTVVARVTFNTILGLVVDGINTQAGGTVIRVVDTHPVFADVFGLTEASATALALTPAGIAGADGVLGTVQEGVSLAPDFGPNGIVSTDGIHPNPRGHAIIANAIIDAINEAFGATIPRVSVLRQRGVITTN